MAQVLEAVGFSPDSPPVVVKGSRAIEHVWLFETVSLPFAQAGYYFSL